MRIALFHNAPSGGAKRAIYEWVRRLAVNHTLDAYSLSTANHTFCDIRPFVGKHCVEDLVPRPLFGKPWGRANQLQRWRDLNDIARIEARLASVIDDGSYDVVFAHTCMYTVIPTLLSSLRTPSVYYLHEPFGPAFQRAIHRPYTRQSRIRFGVDTVDPLIKLYRRRLDSLQRASVRGATRLLANSVFTQAQMKQSYDTEFPICRYGVNLEDFRPMPGERKEHFLISVGELSPRKGFDFLLESLRHISPADRPPLKLACNSVIPEERAYVEQLAADYAVDLTIMTNLSAGELAVQFNRSAFCVYAPVMEPFGLVPLESMACGVPVVGVREGGVVESVVNEQTGMLVARDPATFGQAIATLLQQPRKLEMYSRNCREYVVKNWTWDHSVACVEHHLYECAARELEKAH